MIYTSYKVYIQGKNYLREIFVQKIVFSNLTKWNRVSMSSRVEKELEITFNSKSLEVPISLKVHLSLKVKYLFLTIILYPLFEQKNT